MSNATAVRPLFPVPPNAPVRTVEENVRLLGTVAHVCETMPAVKSGWTYCLVHASPIGVARIASELGLEVFRSKKGNDYFAVVVAKAGVSPRPVRPVSVVPAAVAVNDTPSRAPEVLPARPAPAPVASAPVALEPGVVRMEIKGQNYIVRETRPKRRIDTRRFEVRKDAGDVVTEPYVVSFQANGETQCSCPDWIYRRRCCKHQAALKAFVKPRQETIPLSSVG
jgi:hypothetical protein